jgi:hypothetical protein
MTCQGCTIGARSVPTGGHSDRRGVGEMAAVPGAAGRDEAPAAVHRRRPTARASAVRHLAECGVPVGPGRAVPGPGRDCMRRWPGCRAPRFTRRPWPSAPRAAGTLGPAAGLEVQPPAVPPRRRVGPRPVPARAASGRRRGGVTHGGFRRAGQVMAGQGLRCSRVPSLPGPCCAWATVPSRLRFGGFPWACSRAAALNAAAGR